MREQFPFHNQQRERSNRRGLCRALPVLSTASTFATQPIAVHYTNSLIINSHDCTARLIFRASSSLSVREEGPRPERGQCPGCSTVNPSIHFAVLSSQGQKTGQQRPEACQEGGCKSIKLTGAFPALGRKF
jgi:hypothetical protein